VATARRLVVLADHTKWETTGISTVAPLGDADVLIADTGLPAAARLALEAEVGELILVEPTLPAPSLSPVVDGP